jgi:uncharacterized membrane protein YtjA (UPF0391 family)
VEIAGVSPVQRPTNISPPFAREPIPGAKVNKHSDRTSIRNAMLSWSITFLVVALIAAVLGFGGIAGTAAGIAKVLFLVFLVLFVLSFIVGRRPPAA